MKVCITGSSSGIGLAAKKLFLSKGFDLVTFDRSDKRDLEKNLDAFLSSDFDFYINNAHAGFKQVELLYKLWEMNNKRQCTVINIGSVSSDGNKDYVNNYAVEKSALEKACTQLQLINSRMRVSLLKLGRVDTPMVEHIQDVPKLDTSYVVDAINWIINQPKNIVIKNLTLDVVNSRVRKAR
jgi:NADP-dependent 3-hydroxy acid dehydrogenase YdfG